MGKSLLRKWEGILAIIPSLWGIAVTPDRLMENYQTSANTFHQSTIVLIINIAPWPNFYNYYRNFFFVNVV